jgi:uncharacterized protein
VNFLLFCLVVGAAFFIEAVVGFGASILPLAIGFLLLPAEQILPLIQPVNLLLSGYLAARGIRQLDRFFLLHRVLPWMGAFFIVGFLVSRLMDGMLLKLIFGFFVLVLSVLQLRRPPQTKQAPLSYQTEALWLSIAGVIHGIYASGGPMVVYCASRRIEDKTSMRATLSLIWFCFSTALVTGYTLDGRVNTTSLQQSAWLLLPLFLGGRLGELVHHKLPAAQFRTLVYLLLLIASVFLVVSTLLR